MYGVTKNCRTWILRQPGCLQGRPYRFASLPRGRSVEVPTFAENGTNLYTGLPFRLVQYHNSFLLEGLKIVPNMVGIFSSYKVCSELEFQMEIDAEIKGIVKSPLNALQPLRSLSYFNIKTG